MLDLVQNLSFFNAFSSRCFPLLLNLFYFRHGDQKQVVEFDEGEVVTNRLVAEDEEMEDIAEL